MNPTIAENYHSAGLDGSWMMYIDTDKDTVTFHNVHTEARFSIPVNAAMNAKEVLSTRVATVVTYHIRGAGE